jgi:hypothetical protein
MTATLTLVPVENLKETPEAISPMVDSASSSLRARTMPLFVPRGQLYYWTSRWQTGEATSLSEINGGLGRAFPDGSSAASWLLSDDED